MRHLGACLFYFTPPQLGSVFLECVVRSIEDNCDPDGCRPFSLFWSLHMRGYCLATLEPRFQASVKAALIHSDPCVCVPPFRGVICETLLTGFIRMMHVTSLTMPSRKWDESPFFPPSFVKPVAFVVQWQIQRRALK